MANEATIGRTAEGLAFGLPDRLTIDGADACYETFLAALAERPSTVVCELAAVQQWDSAGLALIVELRSQCRQRGIVWRTTGDDSAFGQALLPLASLDPAAADLPPPRGALLERLTARVIDLGRELHDSIAFVGDLIAGLARGLRQPRRIRWRDVFFYLDRNGSDALPIVLLITFLMGLIVGFQAAVQMHKLGGDNFVADLVGYSIVRELGPLMVAMICTGRAGSAYAAELGTMKVNEEVDALITMGLEPMRFLVVPKVVALALAMPLLTLYGDLMGIVGGMLVTVTTLEIPVAVYLRQTVSVVGLWDVGQGLVKSVVFAVLIAAVGCQHGLKARQSALDVGRATTAAVVYGVFYVVLADTVLTMIFNNLG